jgi:hypothetical protein
MQVQHQNEQLDLINQLQITQLSNELLDMHYNVARSCLFDDKLDYALHAKPNQSFELFIAERNLSNTIISLKTSKKS